jgi:hypothetical protein
LGFGELLWKGTWEGERRKRRRWMVWKSKDECFGKLGGEQRWVFQKVMERAEDGYPKK